MSREQHFILSDPERKTFLALMDAFADADFYGSTNAVARDLKPAIEEILPKEIVSAVQGMKLGTGPELIAIQNLPVDDILPSNESLKERVQAKTRMSELCLVGINALLEGSFQEEKSSHQRGYIHQVTPVKDFVTEASGRGGGAIPFHAENMFIKDCPSCLSLFCLQGEAGVETEYLYVSDILKRLSHEVLEQLKRPVYTVTSGDGFARKTLNNTPILDELENGWVACRLYEEDRIFSEDLKAQEAIAALHQSIIDARDADLCSIELQAGTLLLLSNAVRKQRYGGLLHGRRGDMSVKNVGLRQNNRWLQRVCIQLSYQ